MWPHFIKYFKNLHFPLVILVRRGFSVYRTRLQTNFYTPALQLQGVMAKSETLISIETLPI